WKMATLLIQYVIAVQAVSDKNLANAGGAMNASAKLSSPEEIGMLIVSRAK
ncbi:unnamed protein product, partial [marine sediment metagenome]